MHISQIIITVITHTVYIWPNPTSCDQKCGVLLVIAPLEPHRLDVDGFSLHKGCQPAKISYAYIHFNFLYQSQSLKVIARVTASIIFSLHPGHIGPLAILNKSYTLLPLTFHTFTWLPPRNHMVISLLP